MSVKVVFYIIYDIFNGRLIVSKKIIAIPKLGEVVEVSSEHNFVIVGANGSGKSKLGAYIERNKKTNILRISAQRALTIPDSVTIGSEQQAINEIVYGRKEGDDRRIKWNFGEETTRLVNDYSQTLAGIFAKKNLEMEEFFAKHKKDGNVDLSEVEFITDKIVKVWDRVFPHRRIRLKDAKVEVFEKEEDIYHGKNMSDGERVALYLICQCFLVPDEYWIIIDEPEVHLNKAIMIPLWDTIEEYCSNKTFVYITHDLDFAVSRSGTTKIWVKEFHGGSQWNWDIVEEEGVPEKLLLEVLGSRKNVLFVEGTKDSLDFKIYSKLYKDKYVVPCLNCRKVIEFTRSFRNDTIFQLHQLKVTGLIDRDFLSDEEIEAYRKDGIVVLPVAEVENLLLLKGVITAVAELLGKDPKVTFDLVSKKIFKDFANDIQNQILKKSCREIRYKLSSFATTKNVSIGDLEEEFNKCVQNVDVKKIIDENAEIYRKALVGKNYEQTLMIFNKKALIRSVAEIFEFKSEGYTQLVIRYLGGSNRTANEIRKAIFDVMPCLDEA